MSGLGVGKSRIPVICVLDVDTVLREKLLLSSYPKTTPRWRLHSGAPCGPNPLSCPADQRRPAVGPRLSFQGCMNSPCQAAPAPLSLPAACLAVFAHC